jgi:dihydropyrimidinase
VNSGRLTPNEFVAVTSANSARILNIYPQKGVIMPGADADIVIWDPKATKTISAKNQVSRIEYNVFEGYALTGLPAKVYLRGRLAAENGKVRAERGEGRFVSRRPLPAFAEAQRLWKANTAPKAVAR